MRVLRRRPGGLGLAELLVVMGLVIGLMTMVTLMFWRGRDGVRLSTERLQTAGRAQRAMDALTPYVLSAVRENTPPLEVRDLTPEVLTDPCALVVTTRERFLAPDYRPTAPYVPSPLVPALRFQIRFVPAQRELVVEQLRRTSSGTEEVDPAVRPRLLGRDLDGCGFRSLSPGSVEVTLRTRAESDDPRRPGGATTSQLKALLAAPGVR